MTHDTIAPDGPFTISLKLHLRGVPDTEMAGYDAHAEIDLPPGKVPTEDEIARMVRASLRQVGPSFRLATREEFVNGLVEERTGGMAPKLAVSGPTEFTLASMMQTPSDEDAEDVEGRPETRP